MHEKSMSMIKLQSIENLLKLTENPNTERAAGDTDKGSKTEGKPQNKGIGTTDDRDRNDPLNSS